MSLVGTSRYSAFVDHAFRPVTLPSLRTTSCGFWSLVEISLHLDFEIHVQGQNR